MKTELLTNSVHISLFIQIIIAIITFSGMFVNVPENDKVLIDILTLENITQGIEALFYSYIAITLSKCWAKIGNPIPSPQPISIIVDFPCKSFEACLYLDI